jgi:hypothetical protein
VAVGNWKVVITSPRHHEDLGKEGGEGEREVDGQFFVGVKEAGRKEGREGWWSVFERKLLPPPPSLPPSLSTNTPSSPLYPSTWME